MSYNILDGGVGRLEQITAVIRGQRPDVVALVEADDPNIVEQLAVALEMDFIHAPGNSKASALLSRFAIAQTINHAPLHPELSKSFLEATVLQGDGEWVVGVVHLHARATEADETIRQREIDCVLNIFRPHREARRPHLLAGDFNANSPIQQIDPRRCKLSTREAWKQNGGQIPRRVIQAMLDAGYVDSLAVVHPQEARTAGSFSTEFPGQRVDYIFTFGIDPRHVSDAWITYDPPANQASDHFPVGLEIVN